MTSEFSLRLFELLQSALPKQQALEAVVVLEKTIEEHIQSNKALATKEDIKVIEKRIERVEDKLDKMIYWVAGAIIAQSGIIVALLKLLDLVK